MSKYKRYKKVLRKLFKKDTPLDTESTEILGFKVMHNIYSIDSISRIVYAYVKYGKGVTSQYADTIADVRYKEVSEADYKKYIGKSLDYMYGDIKCDTVLRDVSDLLQRILIEEEFAEYSTNILMNGFGKCYYTDTPNKFISDAIEMIKFSVFPNNTFDEEFARKLELQSECYKVNREEGYIYSEIDSTSRLYYWTKEEVIRKITSILS